MRHFPSILRFPAGVAAALMLALGLGAGCQGYHQASLMHPQIHSIAIGEFRNETPDAGLTVHLRQKLADQFMTDGSIAIKGRERADVVVQGRITGMSSGGLAANRRAREARDQDNRDAYQTTVYEATVAVEYEVVMPGLRRPVLDKREVKGKAEYASLPDFAVARDEAMRRAVQDAAQQIALAITEGW